MECKYGSAGPGLYVHRELIDTLWNVNIYSLLFRLNSIRINRYIMECKCRMDMTHEMQYRN